MTKINFLIILVLSLTACSWNDKQSSLDQNSPHGLKAKHTGKWRCQSGGKSQWLCNDLSKPGSPTLATKAEQEAAAEEKEVSLDDTALAISESNKPRRFEPNTSTPAPVALTEPTPTVASTRPTTTAPTTDNPAVKNDPTPVTLTDSPNSYVAVQIMAAKKAGTIESFKQRHPQIDFIDIETMINDEPWQVLLLGVYANVSEAEQAVEAAGLSLNKVWIRSVGQIKRSLTKQP